MTSVLPRETRPPGAPNTRLRKIPFLVIAPTVVLIVGLAAGFALAVSGTARLRAQSDDAAELRCRLLSITLAERLRRTSEEDRAIVLERERDAAWVAELTRPVARTPA